MERDNRNHFSILPFDLIIRIISFLQFVDAYRFSMATKEWYQLSLWLFCPSFELHEASFMFPEERQILLNRGQKYLAMDMKKQGKFRYLDFMNQMLPRLASKVLKSFNIHFYYCSIYYERSINEWIEIAVSKQVQELSLDFSDGDPIEPYPVHFYSTPQFILPTFLYKEGKSLRVLNVNTCGLGYCNFQNFRLLTKLSFTRICIFTGDMEHIISSCPLLESLSIMERFRILSVKITFYMLKLKRLTLRNCEPLTQGVDLWLPTLQYFEYGGKMVPMKTKGMLDLEEVILDYDLNPYYPYNIEDVRSLFQSFLDATIMKVSTSVLRILPTQYLQCEQPLFQLWNLEHLTLNIGMEHSELPGILCLLRCSPFLKMLSISTGNILYIPEFRNRLFLPFPGAIWRVEDGWVLEHLKWITSQEKNAKSIFSYSY